MLINFKLNYIYILFALHHHIALINLFSDFVFLYNFLKSNRKNRLNVGPSQTLISELYGISSCQHEKNWSDLIGSEISYFGGNSSGGTRDSEKIRIIFFWTKKT